MPGNNRTKTVWFLFQGGAGKRYAEAMRKRMGKYAPGFTFRISSDGADTAAGTLFDRIRADCQNVHAVVAILSRDPRRALKAGNLWLELGLWLGTRDPELLCICRQKHPEVVSERLISDLSGMISREFRTED